MKNILLTIATVLFLTAPASASHETTDNMFTFHAWCNMLSQHALMADNYEGCVANRNELFGQFDDIIKYLSARDQHRANMVKFLDALPTEDMSGEAILLILYTSREEI